VPVVGDFTADDGQEVFLYGIGTIPDALVSFGRDGSGTVTTTSTPFSVNGHSYRPVAANVDGDPQDEVIWYGLGAAADHLWNFDAAGVPTSTPLSIAGRYDPVAGDFTGDGTDDVLFYGPEAEADYLWDFDADGSHTSVPLSVSGFYLPVVGSFGGDATDDVVWYGPTFTADHLWDFRPSGTGPSWQDVDIDVNGQYRPFSLDIHAEGAGGSDVFWYGPGTAPDSFWDYRDGTLRRTLNDRVDGEYWPHVAADLFGDGSDDILWFTDLPDGTGPVNVWDHSTSAGGALVRARYTLPQGFWLQPSATASRPAG
jgi:hypothetical protein